MRQPLDAESGWPEGESTAFLDFSDEDFGPDGSVVDADGTLWNAQWGAGRVAAYAPDGTLLRTIATGAAHSTCPAFGGPDLTTLFCTSATQGLDLPADGDTGQNGMTFAAPEIAQGQPEPQVRL